VTRSNHRLGNDSVQRSVRTVESARQNRVVDVTNTVPPQFGANIGPRDIRHGDIDADCHPVLLEMKE